MQLSFGQLVNKYLKARRAIREAAAAAETVQKDREKKAAQAEKLKVRSMPCAEWSARARAMYARASHAREGSSRGGVYSGRGRIPTRRKPSRVQLKHIHLANGGRFYSNS